MGEGSGIRVRFIKELLDTADKLTFSTQKREKSDVHPISIGTRGGERGFVGGGCWPSLVWNQSCNFCKTDENIFRKEWRSVLAISTQSIGLYLVVQQLLNIIANDN